MSKYQDALNRLKVKTNELIIGYYKDEEGFNRSGIKGYENKDCNLLQELVDKETPMEPKNREIENLVENGFIPLIVGECGKCDCEILEQHKYCWNCGQAIKWQ